MFKSVSSRVDFPAEERKTLEWWYQDGIVQKYLTRNDDSDKKWSFIDGPITANNPMGVHHAWGRAYKDFYQRYHTMLGFKQRYQNGFDCQGLWVEVEVEKELGFNSKQDIENYGIDAFVQRCKERVYKYADIQTEQTKRLGNFMDWDNSYFTMSDENNYTIWHFLKVCHERGWIYRGEDVMPWCPRCETGISEMEATEGYQDLVHRSVYLLFPLVDRENEYLMVWTTTPWTLAANVAAAVHPELDYVKIKQDDKTFYLAKEAAKTAIRGEHEVVGEIKGEEMLGWRYQGPFDELPAERSVTHKVISWDEVSAAEGTGIVHIAPGAGREDFGLSKEHSLDVVAPLNEDGTYRDGFDWLTGQYVHDVAKPIIRSLRDKGILYHDYDYKHRYPTCWRCKTDLVFRLVEEWFIAVDPWRNQIQDSARQVRWIPEFGLDRELDWLRNMDDWMISKKRYWGLALPIWVCDSCEHFDVVGSETELQERAIEGWDEFSGHSPHRPWVDKVKIACSECGGTASRIPDVGNPWLDAGVVPFSTLQYRHDREYWDGWYPADFITESFPGQFRNWFYSMLAQGTVLEGNSPFKTVLGFALMRDEKGEEMHKSKGNSIEFNEGADTMGVDVMRWLYLKHNPAANLNFGYKLGDEVRRQFLLPLWNSYAFFANYAALDGFNPADHDIPMDQRTQIDRWIISRLQEVIGTVHDRIAAYDSLGAARTIENFVVDELSQWYIRRNRRRFWKTESDQDKIAAYLTLYEVLVDTTKMLAPFMPFVTETMYENLVRNIDPNARVSVHLNDFPQVDQSKIDTDLTRDMSALINVVGLGRAARSKANVKVRQPLGRVLVGVRQGTALAAVDRMQAQLLEELNVKGFEVMDNPDEYVSYGVRPNFEVLGPKYGSQVNAVRGEITKLDPARLAQLKRANRATEITVDGETVELMADEYLVDVTDREGFSVVEDRDYIVALDLEITPELEREGMARDFVRAVQDARKRAELQIEDTINTVYNAEGDLAQAIEEHAEYIKAETLSQEMTAGEPDGSCGFVDEVKVGKQKVSVGITRVGTLAKATGGE